MHPNFSTLTTVSNYVPLKYGKIKNGGFVQVDVHLRVIFFGTIIFKERSCQKDPVYVLDVRPCNMHATQPPSKNRTSNTTDVRKNQALPHDKKNKRSIATEPMEVRALINEYRPLPPKIQGLEEKNEILSCEVGGSTPPPPQTNRTPCTVQHQTLDRKTGKNKTHPMT